MEKRLLSVLLALAIGMLFALPALGAATADEIAELTKDYVEITWYFPRPVGNMSSQDSIEEYLIEYLKDTLNCALRMYPIDQGSYNEKMLTMCAAGEPFDMFFTTSWGVDPINGVSQGYFYPITELLPKYGQAILEKNDERVWGAATFSGEIMFVPMQTPFAQGSAICFNADLFDKYEEQLGMNYKELTNLQQLEPYLALIKENEPDIIPLQSAVGHWNLTAWPIATGVNYYEETGELGLAVDDPFTIESFKTLADYYRKGYIAKDNIVRTETKAEIMTGQYAVFPDPGEYSEDGSKSSGMYGFRCYETLYGYPVIRTSSMLSGTGISASSSNPERAMLLINEIWKDRYLSNTIAYGLEGQDYVVISGDTSDPAVDTVIEANSGDDQHWAIWHNWVGPLWDQWSSNWNTTAALQKMQENNLNAPVSNINGFVFDSEPVKTELAAITAVQLEFGPILNNGTSEDVDATLEQYRSRLINAGIENVQAEAQRQLDAWRATNVK